MQLTITIPQDWQQPKFWLGQHTKQGLIIGVEYYPYDTVVAEKYGYGWNYSVLPSKNSDEVCHYSEEQLKPLSADELQQQLKEELEKYQQKVKTIQDQLAVINKGSNNA